MKRNGERIFHYNDRNFNRRVFVPALRRAGIPDFRFHDLRHAFASRLAVRGVDLYTIARLMGHHSIRMTERYAHLTDEALRGAVERLASFREQVAPELALAGRGSEKWWTQQDLDLRPLACELWNGRLHSYRSVSLSTQRARGELCYPRGPGQSGSIPTYTAIDRDGHSFWAQSKLLSPGARSPAQIRGTFTFR